MESKYAFYEPYNNTFNYRFIHPTKSGGTAVEKYFKKYYSNNICGEGHDNTCKNNNNPIIIVRDVKKKQDFILCINIGKMVRLIQNLNVITNGVLKNQIYPCWTLLIC